MSTTFNIADLFEAAAAMVPDRPALRIDDVRRTYRELEGRANALASHLRSVGVRKDDHVGVYGQNCAEWVEAALACYKLRAVPVNINYRYVDEELRYLFDEADLVALLHQRRYADRVERVLGASRELPLRHIVTINDESDLPPPVDAADYEEALSEAQAALEFEPRSPDDRYVLYTGGTTGYPKGVLWRHEDVIKAHRGNFDPETGVALEHAWQIAERLPSGQPVTRLALGQLMHGNGLWSMLITLFWGGRIVMMSRFDAARAWALVDEELVDTLGFVGDAMGRPLMEELDRNRERYRLTSLRSVGSAAAVLSPAVQTRLIRLLPDGVGFSEGIGSSESGAEGGGPVDPTLRAERGGPTVHVGPDVSLLDEACQPIAMVPGAVGRIARRGNIALGYYKDPDKTAATFPVIDGVRHAVPGDYARVIAPGEVVLLGRGSAVINSGGEKVFPDEVEGVVKAHPLVLDATVVGVPDERWGETVGVVVQLRPGSMLSLGELQEHCRGHLAAYKIPRRLTVVEDFRRSPSGKPDYAWARGAMDLSSV